MNTPTTNKQTDPAGEAFNSAVDDITAKFFSWARNLDKDKQLDAIEARAAIRTAAEALAAERVKVAVYNARADEFLWFVRKLREYMFGSTSPKLKAFEYNFIEHNEREYRKHLAEQDRLAAIEAKEPTS